MTVFFLILSGAWLRFIHLGERSFWNDEAWLANVLIQKNLFQVFAAQDPSTPPLPPLFLFFSHCIVILSKPNEFFLRLLPCLSGILALPFIYFFAKQLFDRKAALASLFLISFNTFCIYYSKELKPYSTEMFFAVLFLFLAEKLIRDSEQKKNFWLFGLVSVAGIFISHSFIFISSVVSLVIIAEGSRKNRAAARFGVSIFLITLSLFVFLFLFYTQKRISPALAAYWIPNYVDGSSVKSFLSWNLATAREFFNLYSNFHYVSPPFIQRVIFGIFLFVFSMGFVDIFKRKERRFLGYFLGIFSLLYLASACKQYPFAPRLALFAMPLLFIILGNGLSVCYGYLVSKKINKQVLAVGVFSLAFLYLIAPVRENIVNPTKREEMRPLVQKILEKYQPNDAIYVYYGARSAFQFYWPRPAAYTKGSAHRENMDQYETDIHQFLNQNHGKRVWLIFSHNWWIKDERKFILELVLKERKPLAQFQATGASAYLFGS